MCDCGFCTEHYLLQSMLTFACRCRRHDFFLTRIYFAGERKEKKYFFVSDKVE